jgi:hypothetical protein
MYGVLIEYKSWEKIATILYEGEVLRMRAEHVTKAGRRDIEKYRSKRGTHE